MISALLMLCFVLSNILSSSLFTLNLKILCNLGSAEIKGTAIIIIIIIINLSYE
jgi:hypothetical protein